VIYDQRAPEPERDSTKSVKRRPWRPDDAPLGDVDDLTAADRYVAVDRIDARVVTLSVAPWPTVEPETGRLDFGPRDERRTVTVSLTSLQSRVDADRAATGQLVRAIRPGDVFLIRGFAETPGRWTAVVDVTRSGRLAAKAALYSTAAPAPKATELGEYGLDRSLADDPGQASVEGTPEPADDAAEQPPPGPVAYPAV
jgi:hypothetical protein